MLLHLNLCHLCQLYQLAVPIALYQRRALPMTNGYYIPNLTGECAETYSNNEHIGKIPLVNRESSF